MKIIMEVYAIGVFCQGESVSSLFGQRSPHELSLGQAVIGTFLVRMS
jgi:hypothetical protein